MCQSNHPDNLPETDETDPKLLSLLDQVCEQGCDAIPALEAYLSLTLTEEELQECPSPEEAFQKWKKEHPVFFQNTAPRRRRWGYRLLVIAAAIIILNSLFTIAFGKSTTEYVAQWGEETFGFWHYESDFETSEDGKIIYYPDGSSQDRSDEPGYDHTTYIEYPNRKRVPFQEKEPDPSFPLGSPENPYPIVTEPEFAALPDTDVAALGLEKSESGWCEGHDTEWIRFTKYTIAEVAEAFGVKEKMFPTKVPDGFTLDYVQVQKDYVMDRIMFDDCYSKEGTEYIYGVDVTDITKKKGMSHIEKDDRPVIRYKRGGVDWYIMHNLECVNAVAIVGNWEVLIAGPITVDEMKIIVDSIYEEDEK